MSRKGKPPNAERSRPPASRAGDGRRVWLACAALAIGTFLLYVPSLGCGFVGYDDPTYVVTNEHVKGGLTADGVAWAFTTGRASNWHPLTWLSHMLDVQVYGMNPRGHHFTGVLLHVANVALLFLVLNGMTGSLWRSAAAAALFACHPLRVESVTWVSERKDVLCATFFMLTLGAYLRYVRRPTAARYALVVLALGVGLLAKQMLVTVPFLLLLLDYWPLRRLEGDTPASPRRLVLEKLPLLALCIAGSVVVFLVQRFGGAVAQLEGTYSLPNRVGNAFVAYARYLGKTFWPTDLAVFYPHPGAWPAWAVGVGVAVVLAGTVLAVALARRRPYVFTGWFWFVGMLVPVIGLVQVGWQSMADRYTYLPGIGITLATVWAAADLLRRWRASPAVAGTLAAVVVAALSVATVRQQSAWENTFTLFSDALEATTGNWLAHGYVGTQLAARGDYARADAHFREATRLNPQHDDAWTNWGNSLLRQGRFAEAIAMYDRAIALSPSYAEAHNNRGIALASTGDVTAAEASFREALQHRPGWADALCNLGTALARQGRVAEAYAAFQEALAAEPGSVRALRGLAQLPPITPSTAPAATQAAAP